MSGIEPNEEMLERHAESTLADRDGAQPAHRLRQRRPRSSRRRPPRAAPCARSRASSASTRRCSTRRSTIASWRARTTELSRLGAGRPRRDRGRGGADRRPRARDARARRSSRARSASSGALDAEARAAPATPARSSPAGRSARCSPPTCRRPGSSPRRAATSRSRSPTRPRELGHPAAIFVPEASPAAKVERLRAQRRRGRRRRRRLRRRARRRPRARRGDRARSSCTPSTIRSSSPARAPARASSIASCPGLDTVVVAVGGGGLCAGVARLVRRIAPGSSRSSPSAARPYAPGARGAASRSRSRSAGVAADSLGARRVGEHPVGGAAAAAVDESVLVADEAIRDAQRRLWRRGADRAPSPAAPRRSRALLSGAYAPSARRAASRVLVCGGNFDPAVLGVTPARRRRRPTNAAMR